MQRWLVCSLVLLCASVAWAASPALPPAKVVTGKVTARLVTPSSPYPGTLHFRHIARVAAEVKGRVVKVYVEEGDRVQKEAPLATLDTEILGQELKRVQGEVKEVRAQLEKARADLSRATAAYRQKAVSLQLYDDRRFTALSLEGKLDSLKATEREIRIRLSKCTIRAPFNGAVLKRFVEVGDWVSQGSPVVELGDLSTMEAVIPVPDSAVTPALKPGTEVGIEVTPWRGKEVKGRIYSVVPRGELSSRTYPVKIVVENRSGRLMDGMEVVARLPMGEPRKALLVSRDALVQMGDQRFLFTVNGGRAVVIPVKVLGYQGDEAMVASPRLRSGMPVVVRGNERLRPGQPVVVSGGSPGPGARPHSGSGGHRR